MMTTTSTDGAPLAPNHHAAYPAFGGLSGFAAALTFGVGRGEVADLAAGLAAVGPGDAVVDVGCGPGVAVRHARAAGATSAVGVDPAPEMLRVARLLSAFSRRRRAERYVQGSAEALPLPDGSASVLWSVATVHHWRDLTAGLAEVRRVLRPSGRFLAIERRVTPGATGHASHGWTEEQVERFADECRGGGFVAVAISTHRASRRDVVAVLARVPGSEPG
jgi:ubiquinone/menaquinone biosynthesis C-methylase UbiE